MLLPLLGRIRTLRTQVRSLLYLYFIFVFASALTSYFVQISIFDRFSNVSINIISVMLSFTGLMVGFCVFGYIFSHYKLDAKLGFYYSFICFAVGLLLLSKVETLSLTYLAMFIYGMGGGFFWLTIHTYELTETKDEERDFYSSVLTGGIIFISVIAPLLATVIIWLAMYVFHVPSFGLLFTVAPCVYLLGLFCFKGIQTYRPERIEFEDITHFLFEKRNRSAQLYVGGGGVQHLLGEILFPLVFLSILGSELKVGAYSTFAGLLSVAFILIIGHYRNKQNRIFLFGLSAFGISLLLVLLGIFPSILMLIIFTIGNTFLSPIMKVSDHVVSLQTMESIGRSKKDFYATMILRDFSLWVWRMFAGVILLLVFSIYPTNQEVLSVGLYILAGSILLTFFGAKILVKKMNLHTKDSH